MGRGLGHRSYIDFSMISLPLRKVDAVTTTNTNKNKSGSPQEEGEEEGEEEKTEQDEQL